MQLPFELRDALEDEAEGKDLTRAVAELSARYRCESGLASSVPAELECLAYAAVRMPATYAAIRAALGEWKRRAMAPSVQSLLDLGGGTGAGMWAAAAVFPGIERITLIERSRPWIAMGRRLAERAEHMAVRNAVWCAADLRGAPAMAPHDVVVCAYVLGELDAEAARLVLRAAWNATAQALAVIEPGTPKGFARLRELRDELIAAGAHLAAPCPHDRACPLAGDDWCHFGQRVERTSLHRRLKGGSLGHEDEKFSYVVAAKVAAEPVGGRVIRHPWIEKGRIDLKLCTVEGLRDERVVHKNSDGDRWRRARRVEWGDEW
ncbi:MAG: small ribosomal subunit Rsm22 family protein [Bryobacteraceae bacterium]